MSGPEPTSEVEAAKMANGSGSLPEGMGLEAVTEGDREEKRVRDEKDRGERKDGEEKKDVEEKNKGEENDMKKVEVVEEGKEEKKTEDMNAAEAEDVKMVDAEDSKMLNAEDVKMVDAEDVKDKEEVGEEERWGKLNVEEKNDVKEEKDGENMEKVVDENKVEGLKKKRARGQVGDRGQEKDKKERGTKLKKLLCTPTPSSIDRPVRERKTVERLVEVIEKEPNKEFLVEKGRGTPLRDIPNVAYKLARKKPADLKLLHQTLFGRKGKAVNFKNHILQFSGFVWHESDEKQRAKMKEKLDKYVKDTLLDLCDLFDIPVSKATMRKEDLVAKLLDFMVAPHVTTDVILAEKDQSMKSRKRKRVTKGSSKSMGGPPAKQSRKKQTKSEDTSNSKGKSVQEKEEDEDEEDNQNVDSDEHQACKQSESEAEESESKETAEEDDNDDEDLEKTKLDKKRSSKQRGSVGTKKSKVVSSSRKSSLPTATKSLTRTSSSKHNKAEENNDVGAKVFSRKKKNVDAAKKQLAPKSGKKVAKGKAKSEKAEYPGQEELRKTVCGILKEVDFNTATFTDILKQLATHYKIDLTPRKSAIKELIQEELTKLADEIEDDEDEDAEKEENPEPSSKEVEA